MTDTTTIELEVYPDEIDGGYIAAVVGVPGIMSQGETRREALSNCVDALFCVLDEVG